MAKVKYTPRAEKDLDEIAEYYEDYPSSKQMKQIFDRVEDLKEQPLRGRPIPELNDKNIRQIQAGRYRIIYHVVADYLLRILRIFSYKRLLNPDKDLEFDD